MYDKYTQLIAVTAGTTKLPKNKGLLITNLLTSGVSGVTLWAYSGDPNRPASGATYNVPVHYTASSGPRHDIFPVEVYAVTAISAGVTAFLLT
jgi:hypothetical protein